MSDKHKRRLVFAMVQFLNKELASNDISEDAKEGLEVASQCLQTAYSLSQEDTHLEVNRSLFDIFLDATKNEPMKKKAPPTESEKEEAEKLKAEGNDLMRTEQFEAAIEKYTRAIELDSSNQVFYCNRAAAHSKMSNYYAAIEDCQRAIDMDPKYSKAYGRMGLAYSSVQKHKEALECFKKALEIEPANESYQSNLKVAEEKLSSSGSPGTAAAAFPGIREGIGGLDMAGFLRDPNMMSMATQMMSDPNVQRLMGQLMSGGVGTGAGMEGLLQAGQRLAEQMQQSNPDVVEQLRRQMGGGGPGSQDPSQEDSGGN